MRRPRIGFVRPNLGALFCAALIALCLAPMDHASAQQDWTFTKTANPTTYSFVGQIITYTYLIQSNTGSTGTLSNVTDDKATVSGCAGVPVPPNGTASCAPAPTPSPLLISPLAA